MKTTSPLFDIQSEPHLITKAVNAWLSPSAASGDTLSHSLLTRCLPGQGEGGAKRLQALSIKNP